MWFFVGVGELCGAGLVGIVRGGDRRVCGGQG